VEVVVGSVREPSDFAGLPVVRDQGTWFAPPRWAERLACAGSGLLFLDELTTAPPALSRRRQRRRVSTTTPDVAAASARALAANRPPDANLPPALLDIAPVLRSAGLMP